MIEVVSSTGEAWYAQIWAADGTVWNGTALAAYNVANWTDYAVALADTNTIGAYTAVVPAGLPAGAYAILAYQRVGGSPAVGDAPAQRQGELVWDGAVEVVAPSAASIRFAIGMAAANMDTQLGGLPAGTAAAILATPANKLTTDASGRVTTANPATVQEGDTLVIEGSEEVVIR